MINLYGLIANLYPTFTVILLADVCSHLYTVQFCNHKTAFIIILCSGVCTYLLMVLLRIKTNINLYLHYRLLQIYIHGSIDIFYRKLTFSLFEVVYSCLFVVSLVSYIQNLLSDNLQII